MYLTPLICSTVKNITQLALKKSQLLDLDIIDN